MNAITPQTVSATVRGTCERCSRGSEDGSLNFAQQLGLLAAAGVEGYFADLRRATKLYYLPDGASVEVAAEPIAAAVPERFDAAGVEAAVRRAQAGTVTYKEFCRAIMEAGCPGYLVSILGRRVVYFGRTAECHAEHFPTGK